MLQTIWQATLPPYHPDWFDWLAAKTFKLDDYYYYYYYYYFYLKKAMRQFILPVKPLEHQNTPKKDPALKGRSFWMWSAGRSSRCQAWPCTKARGHRCLAWSRPSARISATLKDFSISWSSIPIPGHKKTFPQTSWFVYSEYARLMPSHS